MTATAAARHRDARAELAAAEQLAAAAAADVSGRAVGAARARVPGVAGGAEDTVTFPVYVTKDTAANINNRCIKPLLINPSKTFVGNLWQESHAKVRVQPRLS